MHLKIREHVTYCTEKQTYWPLLTSNVDFDDDDDDDVEANSVKNDIRWPKLRILKCVLL